MDEPGRNFHDIALKSILFKGRSDWYFCYLKSEKIAHVLNLLAQNSPHKDKELLQELATSAGRLPHMITHFVAGEVEGAVVLADIFSLLSLVRLSATQGYIRPENTRILAAEYEDMVRKIAAENHPSPFVTSQDFVIEEAAMRSQLNSPLSPLPERTAAANQSSPIKDNNKGHKKDTASAVKGQNERATIIYDFVKSHSGVSIKDIAAVVVGCSEKTIQRELAALIRQGLIQRKGEKRWSVYIPTPSFK
jgi:hypothetical protein